MVLWGVLTSLILFARAYLFLKVVLIPYILRLKKPLCPLSRSGGKGDRDCLTLFILHVFSHV